MRSKIRVQLPQVVNKTQASYQHHLLQMISILVKQQKQSNHLLRNMNSSESSQLNKHQAKQSIYGKQKLKNQQLKDQSFYSEILKSKDQNIKNQIIKNNNKLQCHTYQNHIGYQQNKQHFQDYVNGLNSPKSKSLNQEGFVQIPQKTINNLIQTMSSLSNSIKGLQSKINIQNVLNQNQIKRKQNQPISFGNQKNKISSLETENNLKELINQIKILNETLKQKSSIQINNEHRILTQKFPQLKKSVKKQSSKLRESIKVEKDKKLQNFKQIDKIIQQTSVNVVKRQSKISSMNNFSQIFQEPLYFDTKQIQNEVGFDTQTKNFKNIKQYSRLSQIQPHCDRRQIKVRISFYDMFINAGKVKIENKKQFQSYITQWLGIAYRATASVCWNILQSHQLSFDEVQILFTENIIYNFIQLMKDVRNLNLKEQAQYVPQIINKKSIQILNFLCHQYPQTKIEAPNMQLRNIIPKIDEKGRIQYDLVGQSGVQFTIDNSENYAPKIMEFINYLIDISNKQYDHFEKYMLSLFNQLYIPINQRGKDIQFNNNPNLIAYQQKVKKYTKVIIGRKIPQNTPKYTKDQIQIGMFFIKSAKIIRVIAKWAEDLIYMIQNPDTTIRDWFYTFKNHKGQEQYALYAIRKGIYETIMENRKDVFDKLEAIRKQCYKIQGQLSKLHHISDSQSVFLSEEQTNVGLFSSNIKNALSSYLCSQLNQVIHFLLKVPFKTDQKSLGVDVFFQTKARNQLDSINLVTFRIFDLLRCKCVSGQSQILWLMKQLMERDKKTTLQDNGNLNFKVIRFKDRLNNGSRDVLINAKLGNGPVFQMQLSILSQAEEKQDLLDKYNHFLYQLKRASLLGPLIQNVSIWTSGEQKFSYFDSLVLKKFTNGKIIPQIHNCSKKKFKQWYQPMVCKSCELFFHMPRTCLGNWICQICRNKYCGQCLLAGLNQNDRKKQIFKDKLPKQLLQILQEYDYKKQKKLPKYAIFFKKKYLKPQICFMMTYQVKQAQQKTSNVKAVQTVIRQGKIVHRTLIKNQSEISKMNDFLVYKITKPQCLLDIKIDQLRVMDVQADHKLKLINLMHQPTYLKSINNIINQQKKQVFLNGIEKIVQNRKITIAKFKKYLILVKVAMQTNELEKQLATKENLQKLRSFAEASSSVVSIQRKNFSIELQLLQQKIGTQLFNNLCLKVEKIYLNYGIMKNIESISHLIKLRSLYISDNQIKSLKGVQNLKYLKTINFDRNQVQSLEELTNLENIQLIMGNYNKIKSLKGIEKMLKLKQLSLHANQLQALDYLQNAKNLKLLYLRSNKIKQIKGLQNLQSLLKLTLSDNPIEAIENLKCLKKLTHLSLGKLNLTEVPNQVQYIQKLEEIFLDMNNIKSVEILTKMKRLKKLSMKYNQIESFQMFKNLKLSHLILDGNKLKKLTGIKNVIDDIQELSILENPIQDVTQLAGIVIEFKLNWSRQLFTPDARKMMQRIFNKDMSLLKELCSTKNISEHSAKISSSPQAYNETNLKSNQIQNEQSRKLYSMI